MKIFTIVLLFFMIQVNFTSSAFGKDDIKEKTKKQKKRKKKSVGGIESAMIFEAPKTTQVVDSFVTLSDEKVVESDINTISETSEEVSEKIEMTVAATENEHNEVPAKHLTLKGENLYSIARKYKMLVADLILLNNLSSTEIKEGQNIVLKGNLATVNKENNLPTPQPIKAESKAQAANIDTNNPNSISPKDFFIGCYAVAEEKAAIAKTNFLKGKGYNANYFYIPDYVLNGKKLYRIYAGSFSSQKEANLALAEIQKIRAQAYIFKVR